VSYLSVLRHIRINGTRSPLPRSQYWANPLAWPPPFCQYCPFRRLFLGLKKFKIMLTHPPINRRLLFLTDLLALSPPSSFSESGRLPAIPAHGFALNAILLCLSLNLCSVNLRTLAQLHVSFGFHPYIGSPWLSAPSWARPVSRANGSPPPVNFAPCVIQPSASGTTCTGQSPPTLSLLRCPPGPLFPHPLVLGSSCASFCFRPPR